MTSHSSACTGLATAVGPLEAALTAIVTQRLSREAELVEASNRSLDRAREADRRAAGYRAALSRILDFVQYTETVRILAQDALAEDNQTDLAVTHAAGVLVNACHGDSSRAGWWDDISPSDKHVVATKLMLIVSEISEAMEGHRKGLADDHLPERPMVEVELADAVIRIADLAGALGVDLGGAIAAKMAFNRSRPDHTRAARLAAGGKAY